MDDDRQHQLAVFQSLPYRAVRGAHATAVGSVAAGEVARLLEAQSRPEVPGYPLDPPGCQQEVLQDVGLAARQLAREHRLEG